jgi:hypothetical protein
MCKFMSRFTLDVIGKAAFGHNFGAIDEKDSQFGQTVQALTQGKPTQITLSRLILHPVLVYAVRLSQSR